MKAILTLPFPAQLIIAIAISALISFVSTPTVKRMAYIVGAIDVPKDDRRMHDHPIPRMGGLAIAMAFLLTVLLTVPLDRELQGIMLGGIMILVLGVVDDILTLPVLPKLIVQVIAACVAAAHGCTIQILTNPFSSEMEFFNIGVLSVPVTVIWIVAITNAVNFIDGLDGLAVGVSGISSGTMLVIALLVAENDVALVMAALMGACVGFVPYNRNPAKIFMGDTGSTFLGFILATMSVQGMFKLYAVVSFVVPFMILGIPVFDICFAVIRRLAKHRSPMAADREHIHHRLIDMGFSQKQTVAITYLLTGILGLAAVLLTGSGEVKMLILICTAVIVAILALMVIFKPAQRPVEKPARAAEGQEEPNQ